MWRRRPRQDTIATYKQTQQLEGREQHSWFGGALSELSGVCVNDGFWADGVCIDYRLCLMGHNSLQGCLGSATPLNCELCNPHKSTHDV
ncbi:hypothetical protein EYF80_042263 [Liparis tanakae]|uniref:Uncharacterized protein n=1 Tax=Liparis tanakae TaxID=230148 RepID=A0A4Z2G4P4_9TELE|nr:hypothetical protein EYF80_042263 [Liparis tanakae]